MDGLTRRQIEKPGEAALHALPGKGCCGIVFIAKQSFGQWQRGFRIKRRQRLDLLIHAGNGAEISRTTRGEPL